MHMNKTILRIKTNLKLKILLSIVLTSGIYGTYLFLQRYHFFRIRVTNPA